MHVWSQLHFLVHHISVVEIATVHVISSFIRDKQLLQHKNCSVWEICTIYCDMYRRSRGGLQEVFTVCSRKSSIMMQGVWTCSVLCSKNKQEAHTQATGRSWGHCICWMGVKITLRTKHTPFQRVSSYDKASNATSWRPIIDNAEESAWIVASESDSTHFLRARSAPMYSLSCLASDSHASISGKSSPRAKPREVQRERFWRCLATALSCLAEGLSVPRKRWTKVGREGLAAGATWLDSASARPQKEEKIMKRQRERVREKGLNTLSTSVIFSRNRWDFFYFW